MTILTAIAITMDKRVVPSADPIDAATTVDVGKAVMGASPAKLSVKSINTEQTLLICNLL